MMESVFSRISHYGRVMTVIDDRGAEVRCRGFLQSADTMAEQGIEAFQAPGIRETGRYLLLAAPEAVSVGRTAKTVICGERIYDVLGLQPIYCGETLTHWEGVLRKTGAVV